MLAVPTFARLAEAHVQSVQAEIAHERRVRQALLAVQANDDRLGVDDRDGNHPMRAISLAARYARYALTSLATIAFGLNAN